MSILLQKAKKQAQSQKNQLNLIHKSELKNLMEAQTDNDNSCMKRCLGSLKLLLAKMLRKNTIENPILHKLGGNKPFSILAELKKSLMAKKFILKLKKKFIEAILSKEQCILINDLSYDSVAPHIKKTNRLKKDLEKAFEITSKIKQTIEKKFLQKFWKFFKFFVKIIKPDEPFRVTIDLICMLLIFYDSLQIPLLLSFDFDSPFGLTVLADFSQSFFLMDLYLNFQTAYYSKGTLIEDRAKIVTNYLEGWLWIDCLASFPYDWVLDNITNGDDNNMIQNTKLIRTFKFIKFIKVLRMLRIFKLKKILRKIENYVQISNEVNGFLIFFRLCFYIIVVAHWCACIWHLIATMEDDQPVTWLIDANLINSDWSDQYIGSLYWAVTTMITVGYGDIVPKTSIERIFAIMVMLVASGMFAYSMNAIGSIFQNMDKSAQEYKEKIQSFDRYMISQQLPKEMVGRVKKYLEYVLEPERTIRLTQTNFLKNLSEPLQKEVLQFINGKVLFKSDLFNLHFTKSFIMKLPFFLSENIYGPNEIIYNEKDIFNEKAIYFITNGMVNIVSTTSNTIIKKLERNNYFGEISFFSNILQHNSSLITSDFCNLFILKKTDFLSLLQDPELSTDNEMFCFLQQKLDLYDKYDGLGITCYSCGKINHLAKKCADIHLVPDNLEVVEKSLQMKQSIRNNFKRKNIQTAPSSANLKKSHKKSLNARGDYLQIREEALVYRQCIEISPKYIKDLEEDDKLIDKQMPKRHFHSLFAQIDEDFQTEDSREFEPSLRDKMKFELVSPPIKNMKALIENKVEENLTSPEKFESPSQKHLTFQAITEKIKENMPVFMNRMNKNKSHSNFEFTCVKNFDKIQNFEIYFPENNFDLIVMKINKKAETELERMKIKKQTNEKTKKALLENVIDQPVSDPKWKQKNRVGRKGQRLLVHKSHEVLSPGMISEEERKEASMSRKSLNDDELIRKILRNTENMEEEKVLIIKEEGDNLEINEKTNEKLNKFQNQATEKEQSVNSNSLKYDILPKRSRSNDSISESINNLKRTMKNAEKIFGKSYTKFLVENLVNDDNEKNEQN